MKVNREIFRMYDIRGIVGTDITPDFAYHLGKGYGTIIRNAGGKRLSVGNDVRKSSPELKDALIDGLTSVGIEVLDLGTVPTPVMYFSTFTLPVDGGIEVTASHNPKEYNGFKINFGKESFFGDDIQKLRGIIEKEAYYKTAEKGKRISQPIMSNYMETLLKDIKIEREVHIGLDTGNGVAGPVFKELFGELPVKYHGLYLEPDGDFPNHIPDPTVVKYMQNLMKLVVDEKLELGIGIDGDADRIGAIDEKGNIIFGDRLLGLFAKYVLKEHPGAPIVFDVKCTEGLVEFIKMHGGKPIMWKTGHSLLKAKLREVNAPLAGEMSGHIFFNDRYFGYDDAIYGTLRLLEIVSKETKTLSELIAEIPFYYGTPEIRVGCPDDRKFEVVKELVEYFKKHYHVIDIDGARIQFDDGFALVRASNTQPVLVLRFEAKTPEKLEEYKKIVFDKLREYKEVDLSNI